MWETKATFFFPFPTDTRLWHSDILIRAISYLLSDYSSSHSWNEGLSTRNVDRSLCIFHYIHESMFVTPSSCKTSPTFRVTRRHWKAHEWVRPIWCTSPRMCVCVSCCGTSKKNNNRLLRTGNNNSSYLKLRSQVKWVRSNNYSTQEKCFILTKISWCTFQWLFPNYPTCCYSFPVATARLVSLTPPLP